MLESIVSLLPSDWFSLSLGGPAFCKRTVIKTEIRVGIDTKSRIFLGYLERQEIFRKKIDLGEFLDDLEQKLFYILCRFI